MQASASFRQGVKGCKLSIEARLTRAYQSLPQRTTAHRPRRGALKFPGIGLLQADRQSARPAWTLGLAASCVREEGASLMNGVSFTSSGSTHKRCACV